MSHHSLDVNHNAGFSTGLANAVARARNGLIMPDKEASADKIDILSAAVTGLGRAIVQPPRPVNPYESGGLFAV
ncbi:MAG: hypothetical protein ACOVT5_17075 [Armatimonadaceae bacterium]